MSEITWISDMVALSPRLTGKIQLRIGTERGSQRYYYLTADQAEVMGAVLQELAQQAREAVVDE